MSADGKGEHRLTPREGEAPEGESVFFQIDPAWSPDATKIAFASARTGAPHVYVMNADGTGTKELTSGEKASDTHPTWSPDGASIAFARDGDIYVMGADGSNPKRISDITAQESDPAWSPDGDWIAYIKRTPGTPVQNLWVMHPDGTGRRALTKQAGRAFTPSWSPDSARIVFWMNRDETVFELFTIGVDGKGLRSVVPTARDNFEPAWSPDGSKDRLPGGRRDLHDRAGRRRSAAAHGPGEQRHGHAVGQHPAHGRVAATAAERCSSPAVPTSRCSSPAGTTTARSGSSPTAAAGGTSTAGRRTARSSRWS